MSGQTGRHPERLKLRSPPVSLNGGGLVAALLGQQRQGAPGISVQRAVLQRRGSV